jgi:antitoxin ParD1/3/4
MGVTVMARNTSVSLGDHFADFIDAQVRSGRFATASDVVRAGLRLLENEDLHLSRLRSEMREAEAEYLASQTIEDSEEFWEAIHREVDARVARGDTPHPDVCP